jgi:hypothetical protein
MGPGLVATTHGAAANSEPGVLASASGTPETKSVAVGAAGLCLDGKWGRVGGGYPGKQGQASRRRRQVSLVEPWRWRRS